MLGKLVVRNMASASSASTPRGGAQRGGSASVAVILRQRNAGGAHDGGRIGHAGDSDDLELLYIKRSSRAGDPWSAQVAFPGGRAEARDASPLETAIRETLEEVGLDCSGESCEFLGSLNMRHAARGLVVHPFVFRLRDSPHRPLLRLNPGEVDRAGWVPLRALAMAPGSTEAYHVVDVPMERFLSREFVRNGGHTGPIHMPGLSLDPLSDDVAVVDFVLWGLTLAMTAELMAGVTKPWRVDAPEGWRFHERDELNTMVSERYLDHLRCWVPGPALNIRPLSNL